MERYPADPDFLDCRDCVCAALRRASRAMTQHYERAFRGAGVRATQFSLLAMLTQTGPLPVSTLAGHLGLERTTLTRNLRLLEERKLIRMRTGEADQRVRKVELTQAGREAARKGLAAWRKAQAGVNAIIRRSQLQNLLKEIK
jgi:DNA-binding MarR family transcriptional regulator